MMNEGLNLMLYGMGTVFVFLTLLVFCTLAMSSILARITKDEVPDDLSGQPATLPTTVDKRLIAIIEAAIAQHRKR